MCNKLKQKYIHMFTKFAIDVAQESTSNKRKVGAVIIVDNNCVSQGWNGTLPGFDNSCEDEHGKTRSCVVHAEENAILKMTRTTNSIKGGSIFVTCAPCFTCARLIVNAGLEKVLYIDEYKNSDGLDILKEAGVKVYKLTQTEDQKFVASQFED